VPIDSLKIFSTFWVTFFIFNNIFRCVDVGAIPQGRLQSSFLAVGSTDQCVRLLSLSPDRLLDQLSMQIVPSLPHSLCQVELEGT
jgi:splicing factor 3B subunit 3